MSVIHAPRKPQLDLRVLVFPGAMSVMFGMLFCRLWYIQVLKAPELVERAESTRETRIPQPAPRGLIFDRNSILIAGVRPEIVITGIYKQVHANPTVLDSLASLLSVDRKKLDRKMVDARRRPNLPTPLYVGADLTIGAHIAQTGGDLPGIGVDTQPMRYYPDPFSFTHLLGHVGIPSATELEALAKKGIVASYYVGKTGVERAFEQDLMGQPGADRIEVDAKRRPIRFLGRDAAVPGNQLILSIDARLQQFTTDYMREHHFVGGVIAIDPSTGEVLCMVSSPTFDQRLFSSGISTADYKRIADDPDHPFINRVTSASYPPGSTFKIITSLAAYRSGLFDPTRTIYCGGGYRKGKQFFHCMSSHGSLTFKDAFARSCNTYFMTLGDQVKKDALCKAALDFGLGQSPELDVATSGKGLVPTDEWLHRGKHPIPWYGGETINMSIGQGQVRATPLQMAMVACMVANEGVSYKPHVVKAIRSANSDAVVTQIQPQVLHHITAGPEFWSALKEAMVQVIDSPRGTAQSARISGVIWGGKSGSAEHFAPGKRKEGTTHAWFVGVAPMDHPKIAVCVLVEQAGHGGEISAPIARDIVSHYLKSLKPAATVSKPSPSASAATALPASPIAR